MKISIKSLAILFACLLSACSVTFASQTKSVEEIGSDVRAALEFLRELDYKRDVKVEELDTKQMRRFIPRIEKAARQTPDRVAQYEKVWKLLRLIPEEMNLPEELDRLHALQARSFYDAEANTVFLDSRSRAKAWDTPLVLRFMEQVDMKREEFILARDMGGALLTQNFGELSLQDTYWTLDQFMAWRAAVDGGAATMVMDYLVRDSGVSVLLLPNPEAIVSYFLPLITHVDRADMERLPRFVRGMTAFPFVKGTPFVFHQKKTGRNLLVDSVYRSRPLSAEQIMHPEKYYEKPDNPIEIIIPDLAAAAGAGSRLVYNDSWGEWGLNQLLIEWLDRADTASVISGWGGDRVVVYETPGAGLTAAWFTTWDGAGEAAHFESAIEDAAKQDKLKGKIVIEHRRIGRDVAFIVTAGREIPAALMEALWRSAKSPVVIPPPVPEKPSPEFFEIDMQNFMDMLTTRPENAERVDADWVVDGDTFRNLKYGYQVTRPSADWYFHRVQVGSMFLSEFTALNTRELGANFSVQSFDKYGPDAPNPVDEIVSILSGQLINFRKTGEERITVAGHPARSVSYTAFAIMSMKINYTEIFADRHNYIITFWAAKPAYEKLEGEFKKFRDSFEVIK